ncbi:MAG: PQQ-binding-like beta-propeller repeat protein [Ginsengibacter sp.]
MNTIKLFLFIPCIAGAFLFYQFNLTAGTIRISPAETLETDGGQIYLADTIRDMGKRIYYASCNSCHKDTIGNIAPGYSVMSGMTARAVLASMDNGKMRQQAATLSEKEREAVASWLTNSDLQSTMIPKEAFTSFSNHANVNHTFDYSGWGGNSAGTGFRNGIQAGISAANIASLQLKWAFAFPEATIVRSKPALAGDWLIAGGQFGDLYAINRKTGKPGWHFAAGAAIRGAIVIQEGKNSTTAFFADFSTNVYAIDVNTGKELWRTRAGIDAQSATTGSVAVYGGKVFVPITSIEVASAQNGAYNCCISSGGLVALEAHTGRVMWQHRVIVETPAATEKKKKDGKSFFGPSGAPVWCSPTIDIKRGLVYIGTGENYTYPATNTSDAIQAIDMKTGKLVWNFQATTGDAYNAACPYFTNCPEKPGPDLDFGMAPILVKRKDGKDFLVAGQKSGVVYALSTSGKLIWQTRIGKGGKLGGIHWGMATDDEKVYATNADNVFGVDNTDSSHNRSPGLYALDLLTGKVTWNTPTPGCADNKNCLPFNSAAPAVIPGIVFAGSLDGHIRGYSTNDGKILWDFNTAKEYGTVNGIKAKGGAIDGPAPVVADGMLFVNSGYGMFGQMSGNVLLAFEVARVKGKR